MLKLMAGLVFAVGAILYSTPKQTDCQNKTLAAAEPKNPKELGDVHWLRDLEAGRARAHAERKPMLILFQEVPGCSNCTRYGSVTLSHPLIVEAIETYFVPVCIYNNEKGKDAEALQLFQEPAWNNPVVRIVNAENKDLTNRMANFRSQGQVVAGMVSVLKQQKTPIPEWLSLLNTEMEANEAGTQTATFSMHCFWVGEAECSTLPGVIATKAGFQDGKEVVQVQYDPTVTNEAQLARSTRFTPCQKNSGFKMDREPKYYLSRTTWRFVPMTPLQATRANALAGKQADVREVLSPRQIALHDQILANSSKKWKNQLECTDFTAAWKSINP
jgi:hypothetical protein